ncbi:hypothetical protein NDN08_007188 [Rhodosorus marinus]|uniref:Uncharacterized protein n=1 Tax=Rhodosorus marinus TaxID=101924 RepID=A0AAV8UJI7_9RHOD|nr:hypothetical protein NDN08_007188 [Rhodosorus marinus]
MAHSSREMYEILHKTYDYAVVSQKEPVVLLTKHVDPVSFSCVSGDGRVAALVNWRYEDGAIDIDRYRIPRLSRTRTTIRTYRKYKESTCVGELSRSGDFLAFGGGNDLRQQREAGKKIFTRYQYDFLLCRFSGGVAEKVGEHQLAGQINDIKFSSSDEYMAVKFDDRRLLVLNTLGHVVWRKSFDAVYDRIPLQLSVSFTQSNDLLMVENYPDMNEFLRSGLLRLWTCSPPFCMDKAPREMTPPPENLPRAGRQAFVDGSTLIYVHRNSSCLEAYEIRAIEDLEDEYDLCFRSSYENEEFYHVSKVVAPRFFKFSEDASGQWVKLEYNSAKDDPDEHGRLFMENGIGRGFRASVGTSTSGTVEEVEPTPARVALVWRAQHEISCGFSQYGAWCTNLLDLPHVGP